MSERCSEKIISLPIFPELTLSEIEVVAEALKEEFAIPLHASFA
jgi:dTDP-4-amino-4,6-dideoxygalactose transaminase